MEFQLECPITRRRYFNRVEIDGQVVARYWGRMIRLTCPFCKGSHDFDFKQHYIAIAIPDDHALEGTSGC